MGYEPTEVNKAMTRVITGGSGTYRSTKGDVRQTITFFTAEAGTRWRMEMSLDK